MGVCFSNQVDPETTLFTKSAEFYFDKVRRYTNLRSKWYAVIAVIIIIIVLFGGYTVYNHRVLPLLGFMMIAATMAIFYIHFGVIRVHVPKLEEMLLASEWGELRELQPTQNIALQLADALREETSAHNILNYGNYANEALNELLQQVVRQHWQNATSEQQENESYICTLNEVIDKLGIEVSALS